MAIRPVAFLPGGDIRCWHDEGDHGGVVAEADVRFASRPTGPDARFIEITCPVAGCGAVSVHPVGGGVDPSRIQRLFLRLVLRRAAALGLPAGQRSFAAVKARVRLMIEAMDGEGRFRLTDVVADDDEIGGSA